MVITGSAVEEEDTEASLGRGDGTNEKLQDYYRVEGWSAGKVGSGGC